MVAVEKRLPSRSRTIRWCTTLAATRSEALGCHDASSFAKLRVDHVAGRDHQHRVENLPVLHTPLLASKLGLLKCPRRHLSGIKFQRLRREVNLQFNARVRSDPFEHRLPFLRRHHGRILQRFRKGFANLVAQPRQIITLRRYAIPFQPSGAQRSEVLDRREQFKVRQFLQLFDRRDRDEAIVPSNTPTTRIRVCRTGLPSASLRSLKRGSSTTKEIAAWSSPRSVSVFFFASSYSTRPTMCGGDAVREVSGDAFPMIPDGLCQLLEWGKTAAHCPEAPRLEMEPGTDGSGPGP